MNKYKPFRPQTDLHLCQFKFNKTKRFLHNFNPDFKIRYTESTQSNRACIGEANHQLD